MNVILRPEAARLGLKRYFTGKPCAHGHVSERYVNSRICRACLTNEKNTKRARECWKRRYARKPHPEKMLEWAKYRHAAKGYAGEFNLTLDSIEWPEFCPALGIKLRYESQRSRSAWDAPTLDRIDSSGGYVVGNVQVLSRLANTIKTNGTPDQVMGVALFMAKGSKQ